MNKIKAFIKSHTSLVYIGIALVVVGAGAANYARHKQLSNIPPTDSTIRVNVIEAKNFLKSTGVISANGIVESAEQADVRSQATGQVARVNVAVGSKVGRGQVLVSLINADLQAQRNQAEAALKIQEAALQQLYAGAKTEDIALSEAQLAAAKKSLADTEQQQKVAVANAYSAMLNAGLSATPATSNLSTASLSISGTYTGEPGTYRISLTQGGDGISLNTSGLEIASGRIYPGIASALGNRGLFFTFGATGSINANDSWTISIPNTQSPTYLSATNAYKSAQEAASAAIQGAQNAVEIAQKTLDLKKSAATNSQIQAQLGAVEQARAAVAFINAQIAKTVLTSPINGTVSNVAIKYGELVSAGQKVVTVVNSGGLQVKVFVGANDLPRLTLKDKVDIGGVATGEITNLAPSIDPQTKNAEVGISVVNPKDSKLTVGQNISVKISGENSNGSNNDQFVLPIQMVAIAADKTAAVYTVDENGIVSAKPVTLGDVNAETVTIQSGLSSDWQLITSVYGISAGQKVVIQ